MSAGKLVPELSERETKAILGDGEARALSYKMHKCGAAGLTLLVGSFAPPAPGGKPAHDPACFKAGSPFYVVSLLSSQTITAFFQLHLSKGKEECSDNISFFI